MYFSKTQAFLKKKCTIFIKKKQILQKKGSFPHLRDVFQMP